MSATSKEDAPSAQPHEIVHVEENTRPGDAETAHADHADGLEKLPDTAYQPQPNEWRKPKLSKAERRLLLKQDLLIIPLVCLLYFVTYLDRSAYGNARLLGLQKDLHMTSKQFGDGAQLFFVGYIIFMFPGNILLRWIPPNFLIGSSALLFGAFLCFMSLARTYGAVLGLRILIGVGQSLVQGAGVYTSLWYTRRELSTRGAVYFSTATLAGAFSGLIAYGVGMNLTEAATGRAPWEWFFIIEGVVAIAMGALLVVLLPPFADKIRGRHWLFTREELNLVVHRTSTFNTHGAKMSWRQIRYTLLDPTAWAYGVLDACFAMSVSNVGIFLPSFIEAFGFSTLRAQLFSVIPYAFAFVATIGLALLSDHVNRKGIIILACQACAIVGYILLLTVSTKTGRMVGACFLVGSLYPGVLISVTWLGINTAGFSKRATTWALAEILSQVFSIVGTQVFKSFDGYDQGYWFCFAFILLGVVLTIYLMVTFTLQNKKRDRILAEYAARDETHPHVGRSLEDEYDAHIHFRYII